MSEFKAKIMEQMKQQEQTQSQEQSNTTQPNERLPFSEQLRQCFDDQPCDLADLWGRAADSFSQNKRRRRIRTAMAVVIGMVIGALSMHFLASPERWIRL